jgi:UTP--glucose-1-phosphate uridylyltransferase
MIEVHADTGRSVVALKRFAAPEISLYGVADPAQPMKGNGTVRLKGMVEKPPAADAPSDLAIMGRYLFTPEIFDLIDKQEPGRNGEIQVTDAMNDLAGTHGIYGVVFDEGRYDIGAKPDYLRACVEFALDRPDVGPAFGAWLGEYVRSRGL